MVSSAQYIGFGLRVSSWTTHVRHPFDCRVAQCRSFRPGTSNGLRRGQTNVQGATTFRNSRERWQQSPGLAFPTEGMTRWLVDLPAAIDLGVRATPHGVPSRADRAHSLRQVHRLALALPPRMYPWWIPPLWRGLPLTAAILRRYSNCWLASHAGTIASRYSNRVPIGSRIIAIRLTLHFRRHRTVFVQNHRLNVWPVREPTCLIQSLRTPRSEPRNQNGELGGHVRQSAELIGCSLEDSRILSSIDAQLRVAQVDREGGCVIHQFVFRGNSGVHGSPHQSAKGQLLAQFRKVTSIEPKPIHFSTS